MRLILACTLGLACVASWAAPARAANQEPAGINLGFTSFFDGFGRNEEGFTYLTYFQYARILSIADNEGDDLPYFNNPEINALVWLNQIVYVLPYELFGGSAHVGIDFIVPLVGFITSFDPPPPAPGFALKDNGLGLGDITFGPLLQFRPIIAGGRPVFSHRFEIDVIAPTGKYDPEVDLNQGSNFTSINPYWAATVLPLPHLELSFRLHYLYNFKNERPALGRLYSLEQPPAVERSQAGQAGWVNFAASYEILHDFHVGVNGYYFTQFNLDLYEMHDGSSNQGIFNTDLGKASFLGIGPGLMWSVSEHDKLFANFYKQTAVRNWARADFIVNLRWIHGFEGVEPSKPPK